MYWYNRGPNSLRFIKKTNQHPEVRKFPLLNYFCKTLLASQISNNLTTSLFTSTNIVEVIEARYYVQSFIRTNLRPVLSPNTVK